MGVYSFDFVGNDHRLLSINLKHKMAYLKIIMIFCLLIGLFETSHIECIHQCSRSDTCTTEATWKEGRTSRFAQGSCFSPRFGGSCSGIPEPCESCRSVCGNRNGRYTTIAGIVAHPNGALIPVDDSDIVAVRAA